MKFNKTISCASESALICFIYWSIFDDTLVSPLQESLHTVFLIDFLDSIITCAIRIEDADGDLLKKGASFVMIASPSAIVTGYKLERLLLPHQQD